MRAALEVKETVCRDASTCVVKPGRRALLETVETARRAWARVE